MISSIVIAVTQFVSTVGDLCHRNRIDGDCNIRYSDNYNNTIYLCCVPAVIYSLIATANCSHTRYIDDIVCSSSFWLTISYMF